MSGSVKLCDSEKKEMILDAGNNERKVSFRGAAASTHQGSLDDYIDFLSENLGSFNFLPEKRVTLDCKL